MATKSGVAENPAKNVVTQAIDPKTKGAVVDRNMKLYGVLQAFREGRYPDNRQIDETLRYVTNNSPIDESKLSADGKQLIQDVREIIDSARSLVLEKNQKEEFQNFLYASRSADVKNATGFTAPVSKDDAKKDAETAGEALRTLVKLFLRNGEFRKLISDFGVIARDVFADGAAYAANKARPDDAKLATVDQPAPEGEFHDDLPKPLAKVVNAVQKKDDVAKDASATAQAAAASIDPNASAEENKKRVAAAVDSGRTQVVPESAKKAAKEQAEKTANYFKENFPERRRNLFIYRLKKTLVEVQRHQDYSAAMDFFLAAFENYKGAATSVAEQVEGNAKSLKNEGNISNAQTTFRTLLERFANGKSSQPMFDALDQLYTDVKNDSDLRAWFKTLDAYARRCVSEPGFVLRDESDKQAKAIVDKGKVFFGNPNGTDSKYKGHMTTFIDEVGSFFKAMGDDPHNKAFGEKWAQLYEHLLKKDGKVAFKPQLIDDLIQNIIPTLTKNVGLVPLPRIEYSDPQIDFAMENIAVDVANLLPNLFELEVNNKLRTSPFPAKIPSLHAHSGKLTLSQIQTDMKGVRFYLRRKTGGFPKDLSGVADLLLAGKGLTATVWLEGYGRSDAKNPNAFTVKQVKIKIDKLDFNVRGTKHDIAIKVLRPLATSIAKKAIAKAAEAGIRDALEKLNKQIVEVRDAEDSAAALKAKRDAAKATKPAPKGTFKIPSSKRTSILPNVGFGKEAWLSRLDATQAKAKAEGGAGTADWHSPAFTIVNGRK